WLVEAAHEQLDPRPSPVTCSARSVPGGRPTCWTGRSRAAPGSHGHWTACTATGRRRGGP
ncbi:MAG: hypothetical protein AVDCRST_MAG36-909, partial [uncultured Nocardioidaceae bacterium]